MKSHRIRRRRVLAAIAVALCALPSASAGAAPMTRGQSADSARWEAMARYYTEHEQAEKSAPAPVQLGRPAGDADAVLPAVLAVALLITLAGSGYLVLRVRSRAGALGRLH